MIDPDVLVLQRLLNAAGFTVAKDGPGSAGNETNKFGAFTRIALQKFQCAHLSVCSGSEYTSGYGFAGARTRSALLSYVPGASPAPVTTAATQSSDATTAQTVSAEDQVKIAALQAQIAQLTQILLDLIKRRNAAMGV
jgi:peptidoglycan hydrolase-like protein with peptidoglycan-binding domain